MVKDVNLFHRYLGRYIWSFLSLKYILSSLVGDSHDSHGRFPRVIAICFSSYNGTKVMIAQMYIRSRTTINDILLKV